eukprot:6033977-Alexandrium_andersonii.AAC.3
MGQQWQPGYWVNGGVGGGKGGRATGSRGGGSGDGHWAPGQQIRSWWQWGGGREINCAPWRRRGWPGARRASGTEAAATTLGAKVAMAENL